MNKNLKFHLINIALTLGILLSAFGIGILLQNVLAIGEHVTTLFAFAVFIISLITDGYLYGVISTVISVIGINFAFTDPYFDFDFTLPESIFSAVVMLIIAFLTSMLTTKLKSWQALKAEGEKERMRANLLRAVSHDLRTPLTTIYGASSSILENYDKLNDVQKTQMITGIKDDSEWIIRMVENLLSITKINTGEVEIIKTPTALDELIDSVIIKFKKRYPKLQVDIELPESVVIIPMDAILIEQVILNILENSVHHAGSFTKLGLRVTANKNEATFELYDDGCGIERDKLESIFKGYNDKSDDTSDTKSRNAGIGLSVCATIIKAHGSDITAENASDGGAIFRFSLKTEEDSDEQPI